MRVLVLVGNFVHILDSERRESRTKEKEKTTTKKKVIYREKIKITAFPKLHL